MSLNQGVNSFAVVDAASQYGCLVEERCKGAVGEG